MNRLRESRRRRTWRRLGDRLRRLPRCQSGQAIYVVVVFFFLLAGLLTLILNTGEKLNHKIQMQNTADSVAATGAGWFARGLNTISMCNVAETQLLSLIVLCDTLETVTPPAKECIDDLVKNIAQSKAGKDIPLDDRLETWLIVGNAQAEQDIIHRFDDIVQAVAKAETWPKYLTYDTGVLWECLKLVNGFSHAMKADTPLAAQREAIEIAQKNKADFGFVLPLWPVLPVVDGQYSDFKEPMRSAHLASDGHLLGGFAWVMNYRGYQNQVMGPWGYWREPFTNTRPMGLFDLSRFSVMFNEVSQMKLDMLFGSDNDQASLKASEWVMDYDEAKKLSPNEIRRVWWETESFDARYPNNDEEKPYPPPSSGDWNALRNPSQPNPSTQQYGSMDQPNLTGWTRATQSYEGADPREAVWYRVDRQRRAQYPELGIYAPHPPVHPDGTRWPYTDAEKKTYWAVQIKRFNGAELQSKDTLHRDYLPPLGVTPDLAPILFDPGQYDASHRIPTQLDIDTNFTFTGFAYRDGKVHIWPTRPEKPNSLGFENPNPIDNVVAYAQAKVYMHRYASWDTFTQYWKVKLITTHHWEDLPAELDKGLPSEGATLNDRLTPERLKPVRDMLTSYSPDFVKEVTH
jgi:hypothetical protein